MNEFDFNALTAGEPAQFGKYGSLRLRHLKENKPALYQALLQRNLLNAHLNEIDQQAHEMVEQIVQQLIHCEQFDESLKHKPEFFSTATDFRVILKNVNYNLEGDTHQVTHQDSTLSAVSTQILDFCIEPKSKKELVKWRLFLFPETTATIRNEVKS